MSAKYTEWCGECDNVVELEPIMKAQKCPICKAEILPCEECTLDRNECIKCPLKEEKVLTIEIRNEKDIDLVVDSLKTLLEVKDKEHKITTIIKTDKED